MSESDLEARRLALTDFTSNMLVEAAAGTGKTSLMAARVAMMIAAGVEPSGIAAITFTEPAAGELADRIQWTVAQLLAGRVPAALSSVLAAPLEGDELTNLRMAEPLLDEITATTIHGFCQGILRAHGLTAGLDPGSRVVDALLADAMFDEVLSDWLKSKLSGDAPVDGPIATMAKDDPLGVVQRVRELALLRRDHRNATTPVPDLSARPDRTFSEAVASFARWHASGPGEAGTADRIADLEKLAAFYDGSLESADFAALWHLTHPPRVEAMRPKSIDLQRYDRSVAWKALLGESEGTRRADEAAKQSHAADEAYRGLIGAIAQRLVHDLASLLREVVDDYDGRKREAAVLDFDDLLTQARSLVCEHTDVRDAVARRYPYLLVDEFQDTDPVQAELVFCIAATKHPTRWEKALLRPGALFLVGDPKQAIYRFRGADVEAYALARSVIAASGRIITITDNFRSRSGVIDHVNEVFHDVLTADGQPGFVALTSTLDPPPLPVPSAAKLTVNVPRDARADEQRDAEAEAVAELCSRLIGALIVVGPDKVERRLRASDIALLAPTHTDLWRYEGALERKQIAVASQAGNALFRRQELQDLLVLVRTLADPLDTLAFGAFMRGPVVGLTDEQLLDITAALEPDADGRRRFQLRTASQAVAHPVARDMLQKLQGLYRLSGELTPMQLLAFAIERLNLRVVMAARHGHRNARTLANLDAIVELARPYGVSGLAAFARDLQGGWERKRRHPEGRVDVSEESVEIVTMHSAKGLEWPVVIPVNSSTRFRPQDQFVYRQSDDTIHWVLEGIEPPDLAAARREEEFREARQRERLWYVATTRARDLLIIPDLPEASSQSWSRVMNLGQQRLPEINLDALPAPIAEPPRMTANEQTEAVFIEERERIVALSPVIVWDNPSDRDSDRGQNITREFVLDEASVGPLVVGGGALRGNVLHKLMEEMLGGELPPTLRDVEDRATALMDQLLTFTEVIPTVRPEASEMAATAVRTLALPELAPFVGRLIPETPLWQASPPHYLAGRADAVVIEEDQVVLVVDWKSDVQPAPHLHAAHSDQLADYLRVTGARRGAIVYMSSGIIRWVEPGPQLEQGVMRPPL